MLSSRLAQHLPSLFGPSRRAAWRLSLARRGLAAGAILLALHLTVGATTPEAAEPRTPPRETGAVLSLPLAAPADHLTAGDEVGVYLPGRPDPLVRGATVLDAPAAGDTAPVVRVTVQRAQVGPVLREMAPDRGLGTGFVVVRGG